MHPNAHKSVKGPETFESNISGDTYSGVPTKVPLPYLSGSSFNPSYNTYSDKLFSESFFSS